MLPQPKEKWNGSFMIFEAQAPKNACITENARSLLMTAQNAQEEQFLAAMHRIVIVGGTVTADPKGHRAARLIIPEHKNSTQERKLMKTKLALLLALTLAVQLHGALINYEFGGSITSENQVGSDDFGVVAGDRFRFDVTIDDAAVDTYPDRYANGNTAGRFVMPASFLFTVGTTKLQLASGEGQNMIAATGHFPQVNPDGFTLGFEGSLGGPSANVLWSFVNIYLLNNAQNALASDAIPSDFNIADWPDQHSIRVASTRTGISFFDFQGNIDSIVRTPETSSTLLLLSLALLPVAWWRRRVTAC